MAMQTKTAAAGSRFKSPMAKDRAPVLAQQGTRAPDPVAIAELCAAAGLPELTAELLKARASIPEANVRIEQVRIGLRAPVDPTDSLPADPAAVAELCQAAGLPDLVLPLLKAGGSLGQIRARVDEAETIAKACTLARVPELAPGLIKSGISLDLARGEIFRVLAERDAEVAIDTAYSTAPAAQSAEAKLDRVRKTAFANLNKRGA